MKLKYQFVINEVAGKNLAVPVGDNAAEFKGYIKLNDTAAFILKEISAGKEKPQITSDLLKEFSCVTADTAKAAVDSFVEELNKAGVLCDE